ncbi:hypothetical protein A2U01_0071935, partial [Trifolium medium]|nr:hypothetical protein [Trifolium medium]
VAQRAVYLCKDSLIFWRWRNAQEQLALRAVQLF